MTDPVTPHVRALDAINPADLGFADAVAGGVLTLNVNPGSGNPIGGQTAASGPPAGRSTRWSCAPPRA
jgi:imidazolonepropionase-like amidohydrolase